MENNNQRKIVNAATSAANKPTVTSAVKSETSNTDNVSGLYSKKYYIMFFSIMIVSFLLVFWLCNYTKLKEMFQVLTLMAFSIALAEYLTRRYLKL